MPGFAKPLILRWIGPERQFRLRVFVEDDPDSSRWLLLSCGDEWHIATHLSLQLSGPGSAMPEADATCRTCWGVPVTRLSPLALFLLGVRTVHLRHSRPRPLETWARRALAASLVALVGFVWGGLPLLSVAKDGVRPASHRPARPDSERGVELLRGCIREPCFADRLRSSGRLDDGLARWISRRPAVYVPAVKSATTPIPTTSRQLLGALSLGCRSVLLVSTVGGHDLDGARKRFAPVLLFVGRVPGGPSVVGSIAATERNGIPLDEERFLAAIQAGASAPKNPQASRRKGESPGVWAVCVQLRTETPGEDAGSR